MKLLRKFVAGAALSAAVVMPALADPVYTVGGVTWDAGSVLDFSSFSIGLRQFIDPTTGVVSGWGFITTINGAGQSTFCPGCEVTFQFSGFTPVSAGATPTTPGQVIGYAGGAITVFVDSTPDVPGFALNPLDMTAANTGDGDEWLKLVGHNFLGTSLAGTVQGAGGLITGLAGLGQLDVVGGLAAAYFNTNTKTDGADFTFSNSLTSLLPVNNPFDAVGTGNFNSKTLVVPEPATLTLVGLALLGAGLTRRKALK